MLHWLHWLYWLFCTARGGKAGASPGEADAAQAERVAAEELRRRGWREAELTLRRKAGPEEAEMACRLRRETTMTLKWIAKRLKMGVWTHVSNCPVQKRKQNEKCQSLWPVPSQMSSCEVPASPLGRVAKKVKTPV